ncbi:unnamed protein product [Blepharisma stoltei]|uniref:Uncharacterized protein n=1 Tax=Blepharisma stoltei TaxID=1481888 RepID=A0AAU9JL94_9CILI|nr:unnamed protein product [Blepharisma stoltei]
MREYYYNCDKAIIDKSRFLPLLDHNGFIIECNLSIKLTAFSNEAYYMVSFSKHKTSRQLILLSEDGFVYSHTSQLSTLIESENACLHNMMISELFLGIDFNNFRLFEPVIIQLKNKKLALVRIVKALKATKIHTILVISDRNEIEKWLKKESEEQIEYFNAVKLATDMILDCERDDNEII